MSDVQIFSNFEQLIPFIVQNAITNRFAFSKNKIVYIQLSENGKEFDVYQNEKFICSFDDNCLVNNMAKTHRERLQDAIKKLQDVYDETELLRDHSTDEMQTEYNNVRQYLPAIWSILNKIDDKLIPDSLAQKEI